MAHGLSRQRAQNAIRSLGLSGPNEAVAALWLSHWTQDGLPLFSRFPVEELHENVAGAVIFAVHPDRVVICEHAGTLLHDWLGFDLTGHDLIAITPVVDRDRRYAHILRMLDGAISYSERVFRLVGGVEIMLPEIGLPFAEEKPDEPRRILFHMGWRPHDGERHAANFQADTAISERFRLVPFDDGDCAKADPAILAAS
jgi:hypothetical protein